jgi:SNF2 family DNA or RNA helicase
MTYQEQPLHPYQIEARDWILRHPGAGLFLDPGLGKTRITLEAINIILNHSAIDKVLVIAPLRVVYNVWQQEIEKWGFNLTSTILHGVLKGDHIKKNVDLYLINPEGLKWLVDSQRKWLTNHNLMLVVDESSMFKNYGTTRFSQIKAILPFFKRRVILTGTPTPRSLEQLWPQVYILDAGARLGKNITAYRRRWFNEHRELNYSVYTILPGAESQIYAAVDDIVMHKSRSLLALPDRLDNIIAITLPDDARRVYSDIRDKSIHALNESSPALVATTAASKGLLLKQVANGTVYDEFHGITTPHNAKIDAVRELADSLGGSPLLVFYEFLHDLARLKAALGNAPHIGGGMSEQSLTDTISRWNAGELPVLLLSPAAGGHGLNLQGGDCTNVCWFSITFDLELYEQANARVYRQGVSGSVTVHHIVARDTIDEHIMEVLVKKANVQQALLTYLRK